MFHGFLILDGVCYPVIHFCRVILYVWSSPPVVCVSDEYLVISRRTFVFGRLKTFSVSSPDAPLLSNTFFI